MSSNRKTIMLNTTRQTFGIIDPSTKKPYKDILNSFLIAKRVTVEDLKNKYIIPTSKNKEHELYYTLHADSKVRRIIRKEGECPCIISFQTRKVGSSVLQYIAFARVFEEARVSKEGDKNA